MTAANDDEHASVAAYWSGDGGLTFTRRSELPKGDGKYGSDPNLAFGNRSRLYAAYLSYGDSPTVGGLAVVRSDDGGKTWPAHATLVARNFRNNTGCRFADFPAIAVDRRRDIVYTAWQELTVVEGTGCTYGPNHPVLVSGSRDGGRHWSPAVRVPEIAGEIPYLPTLAVSPDGSVYVTYASAPLEVSVDASCATSGRIHVLVARSSDRGRHFTASIAHTRCETGTYVRTPLVGLSSYTGATWRLPSSTNSVIDPLTGVLVCVMGYQDGTTGHQAIAIVTSRDRGRTWKPGGTVSEVPAFEQQMPRLAVGLDGRMSLLWIAQLPGGQTWPSHSWSRDDGSTWSPVLRLGAVPNPRGGPDAQFFLGDYLGNAVGSDGRAHPVWTDPREVVLNEPGGTIYTRALAF